MKKTTKKPSKQSEKKTVSKKTSSHKAQAQGPTFEEAREEALTHEGAGRWAEAAETWARAGEVATSRVDRIKAAGAAAAAKVRADAKAVALDQALDQLQQQDARAARVMEMHCFAGMQRDEIAVAMALSVPTVDRDLRFARAWLNRAMA